MKTMKYTLISLSIIFSHLLADCPVGYTEITGSSDGLNGGPCYYDSDLEVLRKFAQNYGIENPPDIDLIKTTDNILWNNVTFADGRITTLDCFTCTDLKGEIPSDIGNLTKLTQLILWSTQLTGSIPSSIGSLSNITSITITDSQIDGTIPSSIGSLNLTLLDLHGRSL